MEPNLVGWGKDELIKKQKLFKFISKVPAFSGAVNHVERQHNSLSVTTLSRVMGIEKEYQNPTKRGFLQWNQILRSAEHIDWNQWDMQIPQNPQDLSKKGPILPDAEPLPERCQAPTIPVDFALQGWAVSL